MKRLLGTLMLFLIGAACAEGATSTEYESDLARSSPQTDAGAAQVVPPVATSDSGSGSAPDSGDASVIDAAGDAAPATQCVGFHADCNHNPADGCEADISSDVANCSSCGHACPKPENGTATCNVGTCGTACWGGFSRLGAKCASFGGAYNTSDPGCPSCLTASPMGEVCGCTPGFAPSTVARVLSDCAGWHGGALAFCTAAGVSAGGDWAGAYQLDDPTACSQGCRAANPYTGACSCPAGATPIPLRTLVDTPCGSFIGSMVVACLNVSAPTTTFGGAYQTEDSSACRMPNPKTGACSCPPGTTWRGYRSIVDSGQTFIGATMVICTAP